MKSTLKTKLDQLLERYEELGALMSDSDVISDQNMFRAYSREYAEIEPVVLCYRDYERQLNELEETKILASDEDEDIRAMAAEELDDLLQSAVRGQLLSDVPLAKRARRLCASCSWRTSRLRTR